MPDTAADGTVYITRRTRKSPKTSLVPAPPSEPRTAKSHRPPKRTTRKVNAQAAIEARLDISHLARDVNYFRDKWAAIRLLEGKEIHPTSVWAEMFKLPSDEEDISDRALTYLDACNKQRHLYKFRQELNDFIVHKICISPVSCESYGSTKAASDIDVTITTRIEHVKMSLTTYVQICKFLRELFHDDPLFTDPTTKAMRLRSVFHFFDMNYYLSNFAIKRHESLPKDHLSSYVLSRAYHGQSDKNINNQYYYAFVDLLYKVVEAEGHEEDREQLYINSYNEFSAMIEHLQEGSADADYVIDLLSKISTFEDECYHTQGAFFHVVLMMQRKINFKDIAKNEEIYVKMLYASALENLSFAYTHFDIKSKRDKYILRYNDAYIRIKQLTRPQIAPIISSGIQRKDQLHKMIREYANVFVRERASIVQ
jgi:hypothetical protein